MTHAELVKRAGKWLKNSLHCKVVLTEYKAYTESCEIPDAIGWVNNKAILVECKTSGSDFYADLRKPSRHKGFPALGVWRFYFVPPDLLGIKDINYVAEGWGLYAVHKSKIVHASGAKYNHGKPPFTSDRDSEVAMLVSAMAKKG